MKAQTDGRLCYSCIPARIIFIFLTFLGICLVYGFKGLLGVAIVAMVGHNSTTENSSHECHTEDGSHENSYSVGEFDWDDHQQAIILGAFFYGYIITQLPAGVLSEKFGAKWLFGGSILITAILSLLGPEAARWGFVPFFLTRFVQGLAEGVAIPCMNAMIARWIPKMERSRATSIILSGSAIGTVVTLPLTGYLCDGNFMGGWPAIFYVLGIAGCVWFVFWAIFVYETPERHPFISQKEIKFINEGQGREKTSEERIVPWKSIFTSIPVYALIITHFGNNWGFLTVLTLMPTYFTKILHLDIIKNGLFSSLPYLAQAVVGWVASYISDKIRESDKVSVTVIRKVNNSIGIEKVMIFVVILNCSSLIALYGPALCMVGVVFSKCNSSLSIALFVIAIGLNGCCFPGFNSNHVDMAPDFAATLMGITNSVGNTPGFIAPYVAATFYSKGQTLTNWSYVFYISAGIYIFAQTIHIVFSSAKLQEWGLSNLEKNREK